WLQRILHARGVRPVGHADPAEDQDDQALPTAPVIPVQQQRPAPGWPPAGARRVSSMGGGRLPSPGQTITLGTDEDDEGKPDPEAPLVDDDQYQGDEDQDQDEEDEQEAPAAPPTPGGPVAKIPAG